MSKWNGRPFSVYESEEKQMLGLVKQLGEQTNYNTEEVEKVKESDNKKVSHQEMQDTYKVDKQGNFTGSWHGLEKPTLSDEGLKATVEKNIKEISKLDENIKVVNNDKMSKNYKIKSSDMDTSSNSTKIQPSNLSDEVKAMMTGQTPVSPTIGDKEVTKEKLADEVLRLNHIPTELKNVMTNLNRNNLFVNPILLEPNSSEWKKSNGIEFTNFKLDGFNTIKVIKEADENVTVYQSFMELTKNVEHFVSVEFTGNTTSATLSVFGCISGKIIEKMNNTYSTLKDGTLSLKFTTNSAYDEYRIAFSVSSPGQCYFGKPLLVLNSCENKNFTIEDNFSYKIEESKKDVLFNPNNLSGDYGNPQGWTNLTGCEYSDILLDGFKTLLVQSDGSQLIPYKGINLAESYNGKVTVTYKVRVLLNQGFSYPVTLSINALTYKTGTQTGGTNNKIDYTIDKDGDYVFEVTTKHYEDLGRIHACFYSSTPNVRCYINQLTIVLGEKPQGHSLRNVFGQDTLVNDDPLYKKIITFNGDSICANNGGYGKLIADRHKMIYENVAVGGGTIASETYYLPENYPQYDEPVPRHWVCKTISKMRNDADYIILEGGINDYWNKVPLGEITPNYTSAFDETTFCGAFESMLKQSLLKWKGKKIGFIIVHKINNTFYPYGNTSPGKFELFYNKMIEILNKWSIPYLDLFKYSGLNVNIQEIKQLYTKDGDGTHPNELGYLTFYVPKIESWLLTL